MNRIQSPVDSIHHILLVLSYCLSGTIIVIDEHIYFIEVYKLILKRNLDERIVLQLN